MLVMGGSCAPGVGDDVDPGDAALGCGVALADLTPSSPEQAEEMSATRIATVDIALIPSPRGRRFAHTTRVVDPAEDGLMQVVRS
jgi:hypothetical protein